MNAKSRRPHDDDHDSSTAGGTAIDITEARRRRAERELADAEDQLAQAESALMRADEGADPKAFERALAKREGMKKRRDDAKAVALFAQRAEDAARQRAQEAERADLRAKLEIAEEHIRAIEAEIIAAGLDAVRAVREGCQMAREYTEEAARLRHRLGLPSGHHTISFWAGVDPGHELRALTVSTELQREQSTAALEAAARKPLP